MRWDALFDDMEAQLDAQASAELGLEVADRTRRERALLAMVDRLTAHLGRSVTVHLADGSTYDGVVTDVAQQWLALQGPVLVPVPALVGLVGLGPAATTAGRDGVRRRISFASALRAVTRDRSPVRVGLVGGSALTGTLDAVGADHVDLAEHAPDEPRRPAAVRGVRTLPLAALMWVRPAPGSSMLV